MNHSLFDFLLNHRDKFGIYPFFLYIQAISKKRIKSNKIKSCVGLLTYGNFDLNKN